MMFRSILYMAVMIVALCSCNSGGRDSHRNLAGMGEDESRCLYAERFDLEVYDGHTVVHVYSPWQNAGETEYRYLLAGPDYIIPDSLSSMQLIRTPVRRTVLMSTTFIAFLDTLGQLQTVKGISGGNNIYQPELYSRFMNGTVREVGFDNALNYELLLELDPDVVFMFGVQSGVVQSVHRLKDAGINVVMCADYLEPHPLGRAEWLKFFGAFFGQGEKASAIFSGIARRYDSIAHNINPGGDRPEVLLGLPWKDAWYVAGGSSFAAELIEDAGGHYLFSDQDHAEAKPFDMETVFARALNADYWINPGVAGNLEMILGHDERFSKLEVFRKGRVYNNNKRTGPGGGNDYWESGVLRPDRVLEDLSMIFSDTAPGTEQLFYYRKLK